MTIITPFFALLSFLPASASEDRLPVGHFVIQRDVLERATQDLEEGVPLGRALLHRGSDGVYDGYRLIAIRQGTLPDQLGLKNGDIVRSVAGMELTSVQSALQAYETVRAMDNFCVSLLRRGEPLELCYAVR
jgi:type II secretory pathway component PulC